MDNLQLFLQAYARTFLIHPKFLQDGMILLSRMINLETSNRERINFLEYMIRRSATSNATYLNMPHAVRDACHDLVYLKVWDQEAEYNEVDYYLTVRRNARLYTGQTQNWRSRERNLQFYLRNLTAPTYHICIGHRLTNQYHRDALEVGTIAWMFYTFGLQQLNRSPYAVYWYTNISQDIDVDDISAADYHVQLGWTAWRYALLVGTAPPQTTIDNSAYLVSLLRNPNGLMDLTAFPPQDHGGLTRFLDSIGTEGWPRFLDHYTDVPCERMTTWGPRLTNEEIHAYDVSLVSRLQQHRVSLAVMIGHRPTRLTADTGNGQYMINVCGKLTAKRLPNGNCVLLFWMIDPSIDWRIVWDKQTFDSLLKMVPLVVNVIEKIFHQMGIYFLENQECGVSEDQAHRIIDWYNDSLLGKKVFYLTDKLRQEWNTNMDHQEQMEPNEIEPLFNEEDLGDPVSELVIEEPDQDTSRIATMASQIVSDGISAPIFRDKKFDTRIRRRCKERNPRFDFLSEAARANEIAMECFVVGQEFRQVVLRQRRREGLFIPARGETTAAQLTRCWRELWDQRIASSSHSASTTCTCTRCSRIIDKVLQSGGNKLVLANGCSCQADSSEKICHLSLGWQFVIGNFSEMFPRENIFFLLFNGLPRENCVLNARQLMVLLVRTIRDHPENPQSKTLNEKHGNCFDGILTYSRHANMSQSYSQMGIMNGLKNAFQGLFHNRRGVKFGYRPATSFEKDAYRGTSVLKQMPLYAFGMAYLWPTTSLYMLEDYDCFEYRTTLRRMSESSRKRARSP